MSIIISGWIEIYPLEFVAKPEYAHWSGVVMLDYLHPSFTNYMMFAVLFNFRNEDCLSHFNDKERGFWVPFSTAERGLPVDVSEEMMGHAGKGHPGHGITWLLWKEISSLASKDEVMLDFCNDDKYSIDDYLISPEQVPLVKRKVVIPKAWKLIFRFMDLLCDHVGGNEDHVRLVVMIE